MLCLDQTLFWVLVFILILLRKKFALGSIEVLVNIYLTQQFWINICGPIQVWFIFLRTKSGHKSWILDGKLTWPNFVTKIPLNILHLVAQFCKFSCCKKREKKFPNLCHHPYCLHLLLSSACFLFPSQLSLSLKTLDTPLQLKAYMSWIISVKLNERLKNEFKYGAHIVNSADMVKDKGKGKASLEKAPWFLEFFNFVVKYMVFVYIGDGSGDVGIF